MDGQDSSIFDGVPIQELAPELAKLGRRSYAAGQILIEEGEVRPRSILVIVAGTAEVLLQDRHGGEHTQGRLAPGASLGEMAMLSGEPASATVRAVTDIAVLEVDEDAFHRLATRFPRMYLNVGIQLADRLARANRRSMVAERARVTVVVRRGGPQLVGYALGCGIAWHTRTAVLTIVIDNERNEALRRFAARVTTATAAERPHGQDRQGRATLSLTSPIGAYAPERLPATIDDLRSRYDHIVVEVAEEHAAALDTVGALAFRPTLPRRSLLSSDALREGLRRVAQDARIEHLPIPLAVVAADMITQREVVFRRGPVWQAVLASMSIPGIYPAQQVGNALLVDGGVLNPVPTNVVAEMGADVVIAVKLASPPAAGGRFSPAATSSPSLIQTFVRTLEVMQSRITSFTTATATIVLEPAFPPGQGWGLRNFSLGRRFIPLGAQAVAAARGQIAAVLPWTETDLSPGPAPR